MQGTVYERRGQARIQSPVAFRNKSTKQNIYEVDEECHIEEILWRQLTSL